MTIINRLKHLAKQRPDDISYTFLTGRDGLEENITYAELDLAAHKLASELSKYTVTNQAALLVYESGLDYIKTFFACLYAGLVAIPINPPRRKEKADRFEAILSDSGATLVLGSSQLASRLEDVIANNNVIWLATDTIDLSAIDAKELPEIKPSSLALLQYTSGSTSAPKGVMITHANIMANQAMIASGFEHNEHTIVVGWLPHYHDMGLIGNIIQPIYVGHRCILMSPMFFLQKPIRWLQAISKYKATTSGGPNFAYDLCAREINKQECKDLDLSSWTLAFCGAERVHPDTIHKFSKAFGFLGFKKTAFYPCYGLAESTLIATGGNKSSLPVIQRFDKNQLENNHARKVHFRRRNTISLTGCGSALGDEKVNIVNSMTLETLADGNVGEIWIAGGNVAQGYWSRPEETETAFNAYTSNDNKGPYFRSGDLGFIKDGELFVTGREKELIIIRGQNIYPHDVEQDTTATHPQLQPYACIAFSVSIDHEEHLVIQAESKSRRLKDKEGIIATIQQKIALEYGVRPSSVSIFDPLKLPRTSSGKLQRLLCRQLYIDSLDMS